MDCLADMADCFGGQREAVMGREITKIFETFCSGTLQSIGTLLESDSNQQKGEFVLVVSGAQDRNENWSRACDLVDLLCVDLPLKQACRIAAETFSVSKNRLYQRGIDLTPPTSVDPGG